MLGAMFMSRDAIMVATDILTGDDFYQQQYGAMFTAMAELYTEGAASGSDHSAEPFEGEWCTG